MSGTTIYGSTAVCSPIGCFATSCATSFIGGTISGTGVACFGGTVCVPNLYMNGGIINQQSGDLSFWVPNVGQAVTITQNTGRLGIGTTTPDRKLDIASANASDTKLVIRTACGFAGSYSPSLDFHVGGYESTCTTGQIKMCGTNNYSGDMIFSTQLSGTINPLVERMRISCGGNVGIGTCIPTDKLHILGADNGITICAASANRPVLSFINGSCTMLKLSANATYGAIADNTGNDIMFFKNCNIGIGAVSCAWAAPTAGKVIQLGNRAAIFSYNNQTLDLSTNLYFDGGDYRYIQSSYATLLRASSADGTFVFYNAASGTAGCVVSLNERMQIMCGGDIRMDATSGSKLVTVKGATGNGNYGELRLGNADHSAGIRGCHVSSGNVDLEFWTEAYSAGGYQKRMTITSGGQVGINTIDAGIQLSVKSTSTTSSSYPLFLLNSAGTGNMYVRSDSYGYLNANAWNYISDLRMKENISDILEGLSIISELKPKHFDYIDGAKNRIGFIAQDVQEILPNLVTISDEKTGMLALQTDALIPILVKAIQEQQCMICSQSQKIALLESCIGIV